MAKFYGKVGFGISSEDAPGVWTTKIEEHFYSGDILQNSRRWQSTDNVNDDLILNYRVSVITNDYIMNNLGDVKYVIFKNVKWKVTSIDLDYPRVILTLGGVYNGI